MRRTASPTEAEPGGAAALRAAAAVKVAVPKLVESWVRVAARLRAAIPVAAALALVDGLGQGRAVVRTPGGIPAKEAAPAGVATPVWEAPAEAAASALAAPMVQVAARVRASRPSPPRDVRAASASAAELHGARAPRCLARCW